MTLYLRNIWRKDVLRQREFAIHPPQWVSAGEEKYLNTVAGTLEWIFSIFFVWSFKDRYCSSFGGRIRLLWVFSPIWARNAILKPLSRSEKSWFNFQAASTLGYQYSSACQVSSSRSLQLGWNREFWRRLGSRHSLGAVLRDCNALVSRFYAFYENGSRSEAVFEYRNHWGYTTTTFFFSLMQQRYGIPRSYQWQWLWFGE